MEMCIETMGYLRI